MTSGVSVTFGEPTMAPKQLACAAHDGISTEMADDHPGEAFHRLEHALADLLENALPNLVDAPR